MKGKIINEFYVWVTFYVSAQKLERDVFEFRLKNILMIEFTTVISDSINLISFSVIFKKYFQMSIKIKLFDLKKIAL